jgi:hypothetical protein
MLVIPNKGEESFPNGKKRFLAVLEITTEIVMPRQTAWKWEHCSLQREPGPRPIGKPALVDLLCKMRP